MSTTGTRRTSVLRQISVGESLSFDQGRIVITMRGRSGRRAEFHIKMFDDVSIDKLHAAANDESQDRRGIANHNS